MRIWFRTILLLFILTFVYSVKAEVFTLSPFSRKGGGGAVDIFDAMGGAKLWSEPVVVNGIKTQMRLRLLKNDIKECFLTFKKQFPGCHFRSSPGALLIDFKLKDGTLERVYLVQMDGVYPVLQFSMTFPRGVPEKNDDWPAELPIARASTVENTISLPERNVSYGSFTTTLTGDAALAEIGSSLVANGWTNLKQGVFIKNNPLSMMLVSFSQDEKGKTRGFVLKRPFIGGGLQ